MTKEFHETLKFNSPINKETSYGSTPLSDNVESVMEINISETGEGYVEWNIKELEETVGIGLTFKEDELTDYDGVFSLPEQLITYLEQQNYNIDYAK